jgi:NADH-quinone oxidoreductase subunit C
MKLENPFAVHVRVPRDKPLIPSVADVWRAADWHEREAYDLMGIVFENHPDSVTDHDGTHPRRILCPDDWEGHPLRKDYKFPMEYHGIPAVTEFGQTRPVH